MKRIRLKDISFQTQMTVVLPMVMGVLVLIGISAVAKGRENRNENVTEKTTVTDSAAIHTAKPMTFVLLVGDQTPCFVTTVQIDEKQKASFRYYDSDLVTKTYKDGGAQGVKEQLGADYYLNMTVEGLRLMLEYYGGGVSVWLPQAVRFTDDAGLLVSFPQGKNHISSNQAAELLTYCMKHHTESWTRELVTELWEDMVGRYLVAGRNFEQDYTVLTEYGDTDIRISDFTALLPRLKRMTEQR